MARRRWAAALALLAIAACSSSGSSESGDASGAATASTSTSLESPAVPNVASTSIPDVTTSTANVVDASPTEGARPPQLLAVDPREDVFAWGTAAFYGSTGSVTLAAPIVDLAPTPTGNGYWLVAADGGVFAFGDASYVGGATDIANRGAVVGIDTTPTGRGYWLVSETGGVYSFGDASFFGSAAGVARVPVVAIAASPHGDGYWIAARDGTVFGYGSAAATPSTPITNPGIVGIAASASGRGFWLAGRDGGVFAFGDATFAGSVASLSLVEPIVGIAPTPSGNGYWLAGRDGGVFALGDAPFAGAAAGADLGAKRAVAIAANPDGDGYWMATGSPRRAAAQPVSGADVLAIGDSVMLGARSALQNALPGIQVDAVVSRQFANVPGLLSTYRDRGALGSVIVVHLGTNGTVSASDVDRVMQVADDRRVVFVNVRVPRVWEGQSNAAISDAVARWPNAEVADWRSVAEGGGMLAGDGYHVSTAGSAAYATLVASTLGSP